MPPSIVHIGIGIIFAFVFIAGTIFPDFEFLFQEGFYKDRIYVGIYKEPQVKDVQISRGILHSNCLWIIIILFSLGCLLHIAID